MVIVIINLLGLFMSVAYKESHDRGEKERKEGGETRVEVQGRRFYSTRQSEFRDRSPSVNQNVDETSRASSKDLWSPECPLRNSLRARC